MPRISTNVPKFKSDTEEAEWYATPEGRRQTQREFARALRELTLTRLAGRQVAKTDPKVLRQLMEQAKESATRAISIRIPIADLERAKRVAEKTGVGYQSVLKQVIRDGLTKEGRLILKVLVDVVRFEKPEQPRIKPTRVVRRFAPPILTSGPRK